MHVFVCAYDECHNLNYICVCVCVCVCVQLFGWNKDNVIATGSSDGIVK